MGSTQDERPLNLSVYQFPQADGSAKCDHIYMKASRQTCGRGSMIRDVSLCIAFWSLVALVWPLLLQGCKLGLDKR